MLKYLYTKEIFTEVPDEISLGISISNCIIKCNGCNQKELWEDKGSILDNNSLNKLINSHRGITCICFMGSGNKEYKELNSLAREVKRLGLKVAVYLGEDNIPKELDMYYYDYIKIGHWDHTKGGLDSKSTNQKLYSIKHQDIGAYEITCINYKFLNKNEN